MRQQSADSEEVPSHQLGRTGGGGAGTGAQERSHSQPWVQTARRGPGHPHAELSLHGGALGAVLVLLCVPWEPERVGLR